MTAPATTTGNCSSDDERHDFPLEWLKPLNKYNDDATLPSFIDLQRKTKQTLYGGAADGNNSTTTTITTRDKSPKGSVDAPIQAFVDLINHHSSYTTLSSCSGRISVFDPNHHHKTQQTENANNNNNINNNNNNNNFGKGTTGGWRFVSHYPVSDSQQVVDCFRTTTQKQQQQQQQPWMFQLEPMLLHVGAASIRHGQLLLRLALECGYRESGLVVTDSRVTVAIRSHSLALSVPLVPPTTINNNNNNNGNIIVTHHPLNPPSKGFIQALVEQANTRLEQTWEQRERLHRIVERTLFEVVPPVLTARAATTVPFLGLWQSATVAIVQNNDNDEANEKKDDNSSAPAKSSTMTQKKTPTKDVDVWAFGGYGIGPCQDGDQKSNSNSARRSSSIYKLERRNNQWKSEWEKVIPCQYLDDNNGATTTTTTTTTAASISNNFSIVTNDAFPDCQGMAACQLNYNNNNNNNATNWIVLWGGRGSPKRPMGGETLYLWDYETSQMLIPKRITGQIPPPRWGHTLVKAKVVTDSGYDDEKKEGTDKCHHHHHHEILVLLGGCDESQAFDDIYLLHHYCNKKATIQVGKVAVEEEHCFYWERLENIHLPTPKFHHTSVTVDNNIICVFGGLEIKSNAMEPFGQATSMATNNDHRCGDDNTIPSAVGGIWAFCIYKSLQTGNSWSSKVGVVDIYGESSSSSSASCHSTNFSTLFGASACMTTHPSTSTGPIIISGGVREDHVTSRSSSLLGGTDSSADSPPLECVLITPDTNRKRARITRLPIKIATSSGTATLDEDNDTNEEPIDFGSLVHHSCVAVSDQEFLLVGGGVSSFAFGNIFAKSLLMSLETEDSSNGPKSMSGETTTTTAMKENTSSESTLAGAAEAKKSDITNVLFVVPENAKVVKTQLASRGWLDKRFRMTKITTCTPPKIGVPVVADAWDVISKMEEEDGTSTAKDEQEAWRSMILGVGQVDMPFSTARYAAKGKR